MKDDKSKDKKIEIDPLTNDEFVPNHEFDGIKELANNPPLWLTILFIITVLFAYTYWVNYHYFGKGPSQEEEYKREMAIFEKPDHKEIDALSGEETELDKPVETKPELSVLMDDENLTKGKNIYMANCKVCHLEYGEGQTGPNLTDEYWIHGGSFEDIVNVISEGVIVKGMVPWKNQISRTQIVQVASYIMTLQGTNPPNAKNPEGTKYVPAQN